MQLPPLTTPEGLLEYLLGLILAASVFFLVVIYVGII
jgi:hypothetical protein